jgi:hypothetical protein
LARKAIKLADKMLRREAAQGLEIDGKESSPEFHRGGPLRLAHHVGGGADRMMPDRLGYHEINLVMLMGAVIKSAWSATTKRPQNNLGLRLTHH